MSNLTERPTWLSLGLLVTELSSGELGGPVVAEATLPEGASPPLHVHGELDDSFYLLDGEMVVRCGDRVWLAGPGEWVPLPPRVPHTFRVMGGPARALLVQSDDSFLSLLKEVGRPVRAGDEPSTSGGPSLDELALAMTAHGITTIGPCMEQDEALAHRSRCGAGPV